MVKEEVGKNKPRVKKNNEKVCKVKNKRPKKIKLKKIKINPKLRKIFIRCSLVLVITIILVCMMYLALYLHFNIKLYNLVISENNTFITSEISKYFYIWDKTKKYINDNQKEIILDRKDCDIALNPNNIPTRFDFGIDIKYEKSSLNEFKDLNVINIECMNKEIIQSINKVTLDINEKYFGNNIDVYSRNNVTGELVLKTSCAHVEDNKLDILVFDKEKSIEENNNSYMLVYVPLQDFKMVNENIEVKNKSIVKLELDYIPVNATNKKIKYEYPTDALEITEDNIFNTKIAGEYTIKASVENENITKDIKLKIIEVAESIKLKYNTLNLTIGQTGNAYATVCPENAVNQDLIYTTLNDKIATVDENGNIKSIGVGECEIEVRTSEEPIVSTKVKVKVNPKTTYVAPQSQNYNLTYVKGVLVVNKKYSLPSNYNPGVNGTALNAFNTMKSAASKEGINLYIVSGFRSYSTQYNLYNRYVSIYGQAATDTFSAKPGHSEHQTGLAFDVNSVEDSFANTKEGKWLAANCYKYGFIIRYPQNKQSITGYKYEPWHIRYLGVNTATAVHNSGLCLEEYLGI